MDRIRLCGLSAYGRHGADPQERRRRQRFEIDVTADIDLHTAAAGDDLSQTMDYAQLHDRIVRIVSTTSHALLERLAAEILEALFTDHRVMRAQVTICKPAILAGATPCVTLDRANPKHRST